MKQWKPSLSNAVKSTISSLSSYGRWLKVEMPDLYWSLYHVDNLLSYSVSNKAELDLWDEISLSDARIASICEIGCTNGRMAYAFASIIDFEMYIGYDLNIIAVVTARIKSLTRSGRRRFIFKRCRAQLAHAEPVQLFASCACLIYFTGDDLRTFISGLKSNPVFTILVLHEMFNEDLENPMESYRDAYNHVHSVPLIRELFGQGFRISFKRTYYKPWEAKKGVISGLLIVKRAS